MTSACDHEWSAEFRELKEVRMIVIECDKCGREELLDERRLYD